MRKAAKNFKNNAKKIFNKDGSRSATPTGSRSSTPAPEPENAQQVSSTNQPLAVTSKTVVNTLDTTLGILKEVSAAFPPLQAAVGGVIECIRVYKKVSGNTEALQVLVEDLIKKTNYLQMRLERDDMDPSGMQSIKDLAGELNRIHEDVKKQKNIGKSNKILHQTEIGSKIQSFKERITQAYEECKEKVLFAISQNIGELLKEQVLSKLGYSAKAFYDTDRGSQYTRHQHCLEGTRKRILENLKHWAETPGESTGYWIWGMAGTGKSTIAMSACKIFKESEECALVASFFCSRQIEECRDYQRIIPTLSYQLARTFRRFAVALKDIYDADSDIASKEPEQQVQKLLVEPWKAVLGFQKEKKLPVIVLDALDECTEVQRALEPLIAVIEEGKLAQMKFLFTSRPEQPIRVLMHSEGYTVDIPSKVKMFELHSVDKVEVQNDINVYVTTGLRGIATREQLQALTELAGNLFIFAATVVKFVMGITDIDLQLLRLEKSLKENKHQELDRLYAGVLHDVMQVGFEKDEIEKRWNILHTLVTLFQPMTCKGVAVMANSAESTVTALIEQLQAFCFISEKDECIHIFHLSFTEYITRQSSENHRQQYHEKLSIQCFREMQKLRFNICDLPSSFVADAEVKGLQEKIKERIGETLEYSCWFWGKHLLATGPLVGNIVNVVESFLETKGVYWIEAMSLTKALAKGGEVLGILIEQNMVKGDIKWGTGVKSMTNLRHLLLYFAASEVKDMTPHLYLSLLPLWKKMKEGSFNLGWKHFPDVQQICLYSTQQAASIGIIKVGSPVYSVAFSPDGTRIASGSHDGTVRIWDATTGIQVGESLQGHDYPVTSVAFSPDGTRIVSGSADKTVRIWDATTGIQVGESLQGHDHWVKSVAFSPDGTRIVSGSEDSTVRIWDATTGIQVGESLQGHDNGVNSVAFSPDGTRIVSGSYDRTVRIWDATTGIQVGESLQGHDHWVKSVAFSPDGTRIVSGSEDSTVRIWDATTGIQVGESLQGHDAWVNSVAFSPDGTRIVSGSLDRTVRIWDATTGIQIGESLQGHDHWVKSVAFSPDGTRIVSGSRDNTVRIWDATTGIQVGEFLQGHDAWVNSVAFSPDGTRIVSGSRDNTVRIWDATTGIQVGESLQGHDHWVKSVAFSPDGTRIVSGSEDSTVRIWDATTGIQVGESLQGHDNGVNSVAFSPDGTRIVSGSRDNTVRIWDATTGIQVGEFLQGHDDSVNSVAFSPDGTRIVSGSLDRTVRIWDATTGIQVGEFLQGHDDSVNSVAFSPDGTRIVSGSLDRTVRIWDATTGIQVGEFLQGHDDSVNSVAFSPDGTRIVSGSRDNTVRIWDATTGIQVGESLQGHDNGVNSVAFSPDGTRIVSGSYDRTVRIWDATTGIQVGESLQGHDHWVKSVAFSPDGTRIVSGSRDNTVRIWDATTGIQVGEFLQGHDDSVNSVAFSPDGTRIVSGSLDRTVRIWDATTGIQIGESLQGHDHWVKSVAFSPDGTRILSGSNDNTVGESLQGPADLRESAALSPDGTSIVSDSRDRTLRIFHATPAISVEKLLNSSLHPFDPIASVSSMFSTTIGGNGTFQSTNELGQVLFSGSLHNTHWTLSTDGWIRFPNIPFPLLWVPPPFRQPLWTPQTNCIISKEGYTRFSFDAFYFGAKWADSFAT
ncbi:hypothetical protein D9757_011498 [Collybiopsis confluens]|uniref:Nephrocystin 3-like N-terminal domain-containing protein n=1 Tax=Collybiopsis confluens TaxID=2823264 RepID=A0A8H5GVQ0_9AGAR|nr:hypothetical protein D9757_011498 [Collybiopsis confluens]